MEPALRFHNMNGIYQELVQLQARIKSDTDYYTYTCWPKKCKLHILAGYAKASYL